MAEEEEKPKKSSSSPFSIWPPNQRTRDAVIQRLVETLSSPSVLSNRYGVMSTDEAASAARLIEDQAFHAASSSFSSSSSAGSQTDDGIETLQLYSKEISKCMLEAVKSKASSDSSNPSSTSEKTPPPLVESEPSES